MGVACSQFGNKHFNQDDVISELSGLVSPGLRLHKTSELLPPDGSHPLLSPGVTVTVTVTVTPCFHRLIINKRKR